jgi:hypothetical protein
VVSAVRALLAGEIPDLTGSPLRVTQALDVMSRPFTVLGDAPSRLLRAVLPVGSGAPDASTGWGALAFRAVPPLLIEVPHPGSDRYTARLGTELFHALPTSALLIAGAHRKHADVAHLGNSVFHTCAQTLATTELQLHGFAEASAPDTDVVLTPGMGEPTVLHHALREALTNQGFRVRHHEHLAGRTNVQGMAAAVRGTPFLHLELAPPVRAHHRDRVVKAVTDAWHQQGH